MGIALIFIAGAGVIALCVVAFLELTAPRTEAELGYEAFMDSDPVRALPGEPETGGAVDELSGGPALFLVVDNK